MCVHKYSLVTEMVPLITNKLFINVDRRESLRNSSVVSSRCSDHTTYIIPPDNLFGYLRIFDFPVKRIVKPKV